MILTLFLSVCLVVCIIAKDQIRVTCIGDSITEGGGCHSSSYVDNLRYLLGENYHVMNAGKSSMTQLKKGQCNGGGDCSYWNTDAWQNALSAQSDIVTIMLGTNDAKTFNWEGVQQNTGDYFALDYISMINMLRQSASKRVLRVYVLVPPPLYSPYPFEMNATIINCIYPSLVRDIAEVASVKVIDIYSAILNSNATSDELSCDGCHPTSYADDIIAKTIFDAIVR